MTHFRLRLACAFAGRKRNEWFPVIQCLLFCMPALRFSFAVCAGHAIFFHGPPKMSGFLKLPWWLSRIWCPPFAH